MSDVTTSPSVDAEFAEFAGQLFFRLWRVSHARTAEALEPLGLTPALFALLNLLRVSDGASQQELGSEMGVDPSTMVSLIDRLESAGLAKRRAHPTDRRAHAVALTPKGRRVLERARRSATHVQADVLRGLTGDERRELMTLLRRALDSAPPQSLWRSEEGD
jgi:DNA-binding MarR family transcriptional regulator